MEKTKVLIVTNSLREKCENILKANNFEVYSPGDPKVALIWTKPGPDIIITEMPRHDAVAFAKQLREAGYEGLVFLVLDQKSIFDQETINEKFKLDCMIYHITGVFDINTTPEKISEGLIKTLRIKSNPAYLSFSLN